METSGTMAYGYLKGLLESESLTKQQIKAILTVIDLIEELGDDEIDDEEENDYVY
jgi:hypothetical protein